MKLKDLRFLIPERFRPIGYLVYLTRERTGRTVHSGPFRGMLYVDVSQGSCYIVKLLGIYERDLHGAVLQIASRKPQLVIDIGAAEGYYAVGMARLIPGSRVVAFEMEAYGRVALGDMAALNGVEDRVDIRGKCEVSDLVAAIGQCDDPVVICDVEGHANELLDPVKVPALARATMLVELHDCFAPKTFERLEARFETTHVVSRIWEEPRHRTEFPWRTIGTRLLPQSYMDFSVSEWRPVRMSWLYMVPKVGGATPRKGEAPATSPRG